MPLDPIASAPYADPDEFVREVTDRIWVDHEIGFIRENYEPGSIVHGGLGTTVGRDAVVAGSLVRQGTHPRQVGQAEDVVWEARGDDAFTSSHLIFYSDPEVVAGRTVRVRARTIATCLYRRGRMVEEWVVRDELARTLQRGLDPDEAGRAQVFRGWSGSMLGAPPADPLALGDTGARPEHHRDGCELVLEMIDTVWNGRDLAALTRFVERDVFLHTVGDVSVTRPDGYREDLLGLLCAFPDAVFAVRDVQANHAERYAGRPTTLLGVSQFLVQRGRVVREVRVHDEIALRAQINAARGDLVEQTGAG